ncbi:MAG TPA: hypothetical protein VFJ82_23080 [Longimicrobium sp.]|nr:hypothetical protein [Longimicrobium sp.]
MRTDYTTLVLENASVQVDSVVGARPKTGWRAAVALADVKKIEIQRDDPAATFWMAALGVAAGFFGFMYLAVAGDAS